MHTAVVLATSFRQWLLLHLPSWVLFGVTVGACTGISMGGLLVVRRWLPHFSEGSTTPSAHGPSSGRCTPWGRLRCRDPQTTFDRAEETTRQEAGALFDAGAQLVTTGALGFMVGLMLALVLLMNHPFTGDLKVTPGPFVQVLESG